MRKPATRPPKPRQIIRATAEEEAAVQRGIAADPDNPEWTAEDFAKARPFARQSRRITGTPGEVEIEGFMNAAGRDIEDWQ
jgi:hypothetical protein